MRLNLKQLGSNQTLVEIGDREFFFSYETCVAYRDSSVRIRRNKNYSVTTAKRLGQMGVKDWPQVSDEEFERRAAL